MRTMRKMSASGFYHVVVKGEADQTLFFNDKDRIAFLSFLEQVRDAFELRIHAYCLMSNHVHLLAEDQNRALSEAMKTLNEDYARHFKRKTHRAGHVYKNRFWSEPVEDDAYLLCAMRYIHANPAAAGICKASAYWWSSARDYLGRPGIAYTDLLLNMAGGREGFIAFSRKDPLPAIAFPGSTLTNHLSEGEVSRIAEAVVGNLDAIRSLPRSGKREKIRCLGVVGLNAAQIARATSVPYSTVTRMLRNER